MGGVSWERGFKESMSRNMDKLKRAISISATCQNEGCLFRENAHRKVAAPQALHARRQRASTFTGGGGGGGGVTGFSGIFPGGFHNVSFVSKLTK